MRFEIVISESAKADARLLPAHVLPRVLDAIEAQLRRQPLVETRNRKRLAGNLAPALELRTGEHRVIYLVEEQTVVVLRIVRKGRRKTEDVT